MLDPKDNASRSILALDLGRKHIGVAYYSPQTGVSPLKEITFTDVHRLKSSLVELVNEYRVEVVLVGDLGLPQLPEDFRKVVDSVAKECSVEVVVYSEYLTTFQSERSISQQKVDVSGHAQAASELLNDFLSN